VITVKLMRMGKAGTYFTLTPTARALDLPENFVENYNAPSFWIPMINRHHSLRSTPPWLYWSNNL